MLNPCCLAQSRAAGAFAALPVQLAQLAEALRLKREAEEGGSPAAEEGGGPAAEEGGSPAED